MAPTQQSSTIATNNSEFATNSTSDSTNIIHTKKEHYSSSSSSSNNSSTNHYNDNTQNEINSRLLGTQEIPLPISSKGNFFHDDFFKDTRHHFEDAVRNVLNQWGHTSSLQNDDLASYRTLRKSDLSEKSQAVTVTEDTTCHKVVIDVQDFKAGDVKVKLVNDSEVVVEGSVEQQNGGSVSKKNFRRSFNFPGLIKTADITSTMSSEGILTITVPKKESTPEVTNINIQESNKKTNTSAETTKASSDAIHKASASEIRSHQTSTVASSETAFNNFLTKDSKENHHISDETKSTKEELTCNKSECFPIQPLDLLLPISQSGSFFQDSFFSQAHQEFEEAMRRVLKAEGESPKDDVITSYRSLRERQLTDENQAVSITEDSHQHKVVMDIQDFMRGDVKVKVVDENKVVVEGSVEHQDEELTSKKTFRRGFTFSGLVKAADITSTMSSDGVLIITVPKKETKRQFSDTNIQESDKKTNTSTETIKRSSESSHEVSEMQSHQTSTVTSTETTSNNLHTKDSKDETKSIKEELTCKKSECENGFPVQPLDLLLPISQSGSFFQDSFFTQAHQEFEEAMRRVLKAEGESPKDDVITSYRSLRERQLTDENQAVSITEDNHQHKVVMDVRDFMDGGVRVKVVDEDQLVVEGSTEKQNGMTMSKKSFQRSFTFPGLINAAAVTSTLSTDGILTITIHKKQLNEVRGDTKNSTSTTMDNVATNKTDSSSINASSKTMKENTSRISVDSENSFDTPKPTSNRTINGDKQEVDNNYSFESTKRNHSNCDATRKSSWVLDSHLPVFPRGSFFQDSYFKESRQHFDAAVKEALGKFGHTESQTDDLSLYRNLRTNDLTNESQAVKDTENEHIHQVVLDVNDFKDGDIKVKVVGKS